MTRDSSSITLQGEGEFQTSVVHFMMCGPQLIVLPFGVFLLASFQFALLIWVVTFLITLY